jgi:hypothetical protein
MRKFDSVPFYGPLLNSLRPQRREVIMSHEREVTVATPEACLSLWKDRAIRNSHVHHDECENRKKWDACLTNINVISGVVVLYLSLVPWLEPHKDHGLKSIILSIAGTLIVLTTIWQAMKSFSWQATQFEKAALEYARITRMIEEIQAKTSLDEKIDQVALKRVRFELDWIARTAPSPRKKAWAQHFPASGPLAKREQEFGKKL